MNGNFFIISEKFVVNQNNSHHDVAPQTLHFFALLLNKSTLSANFFKKLGQG
jgi:hypothetical protein